MKAPGAAAARKNLGEAASAIAPHFMFYSTSLRPRLPTSPLQPRTRSILQPSPFLPSHIITTTTNNVFLPWLTTLDRDGHKLGDLHMRETNTILIGWPFIV